MMGNAPAIDSLNTRTSFLSVTDTNQLGECYKEVILLSVQSQGGSKIVDNKSYNLVFFPGYSLLP